jgi:hypothetical protein
VPRGGRRQGAGRKPGAATRRTRELAERAAAEGVQPIDVLLGVMRLHWARGEWAEAAAVAKDAAPYCHPRLQSVQLEKPPLVAAVPTVGAAVDETERALLALAREIARGAVAGAVDAAKDGAPAPVVVEALPASGAGEAGSP